MYLKRHTPQEGLQSLVSSYESLVSVGPGYASASVLNLPGYDVS
jgi:hypothetical protein